MVLQLFQLETPEKLTCNAMRMSDETRLSDAFELSNIDKSLLYNDKFL